MTFPVYFDSKKSLNLFGLSDNFIFLKNLYSNNKLPKVLMMTGKKGLGKSTLMNHLMFYIFDKNNYDLSNNILTSKSDFYNRFLNNVFPNIIYVSGSDTKSTKIEDIRNLKKKIFKTSISSEPRFIILDDVELFNINSLNALLKIIEEPSDNNYFLLINNQSKPLIATIKSRCLEIKIILNEKKRLSIINSLIEKFKINLTIDPKVSELTPGYFIKFNHIFEENEISNDQDFLKNLSILLNLYKKNKDLMFIDSILFLTDNYFNNLKNEKSINSDKLVEYKSFVFENISNFFTYNLNQNALLNAISNKIYNE